MNHDKAKYDVFLSYNNRDYQQLENIARRLEESGLKVFLDRWYLVPGISWPQRLEEIINDCRAVAICLGPYGMGDWQQREKYLALDRQVRNPNFPVIPLLLPGADPALGFLALNTWVDFRQGLDSTESLTVLARAIEGKPPTSDSKLRTLTALSTICPYRGLRFFREEDAPFFFGRDAFIDRLVATVEGHVLVAVVGGSGSGKSSVVRAGLVPRLRRRTNNQVWDIATMVPGDRPLQSLAAVMVRLIEPEMTEVDRLKEIGKLAESLSTEIRLRDVVSRAIEKQPGTDRLLLIVDQFEELYTLTRDESSRQKFINEILDATTSSPISVVLTLRGDFYDQILSDRSFSDRIQDATVNVSRMTREELTQVIESPAQKVGLRFESGLANRILDKVQGQPGNLPLLEFVLTELWKERQDELLTHAAYERIGETEGAIAAHAERAFAALSSADQEIARRVFLQLVRPAVGGDHEPEAGPTRRRTSFAELDDESLSVVRKLADAHLIVTGRNEATGEEVVDLVHEALIKAWARLRQWIDEDRAFLLWREQMRTFITISAAKSYERNTLLRGTLLAEAKGWSQKRNRDLSSSERQYISASVKAADSVMRWRAIVSAAVIILIGAAALLSRPSWLIGPGPSPSPTTTTTPTPEPTPEASDEDATTPGLSDEEVKKRISEMLQLIGVSSLEMKDRRTIAVLGPEPTPGTLPRDRISVLGHPVDSSSNSRQNLNAYTSSLVQCVQRVAPNTKFVFILARMDSNLVSDLNAIMNDLVALQDKPRILLAPYHFADSVAASSLFRLAASNGILVITSAMNDERAIPNQSFPLDKEFMTVASVDPNGQKSKFSPLNKDLFWAPGEKLVVKLGRRMSDYAGAGPASALAAGVAVRILDRYPDLKPEELIEVIRATSQAKVPNGVAIINLDLALNRLSASHPQM